MAAKISLLLGAGFAAAAVGGTNATTEKSVADIWSESRIQGPRDGGTSAVRVDVPEGGSVLLECDIPGWTFCKWAQEGSSKECGRLSNEWVDCPGLPGAWWPGTGASTACSLNLTNLHTTELTGRWTARLIRAEGLPYHTCRMDIQTFVPVRVTIGRPPSRLPCCKPCLVECNLNVAAAGALQVNASANGRLLKPMAGSQNHFEYLPSADDSGHVELVCTADQLIGDKVVFTAKAAASTTVVTPPQPALPLVAELAVNRTGRLNISITAYPLPGSDDISWHFVAQNLSQSFQVFTWQQGGEYLISAEPTSEYTLSVALTIRSVQPEHFGYHQYLRVSNEVGSQDYAIQISEKRMDLIEEGEPGINVTGYILLTAGLVTSLLLVILIFSILNAKMTGTCCFKVTSKPLERAEPEGLVPLTKGPVSEMPLKTSVKNSDEKKRRPKREVLHSRSRTPSPILRRSQKMSQSRGNQERQQQQQEQHASPQQQLLAVAQQQPPATPQQQPPGAQQVLQGGQKPQPTQQQQLLLGEQHDEPQPGQQRVKKMSVVSRESTYPVM